MTTTVSEKQRLAEEKQLLMEEMSRIAGRLQQIDFDSRPVLGRNILYLREERKMTQQDLASAIGVTRVTITNLELGTYGTAISTLMRICKVLEVTPNDLLLETKR